MQGWVDALVLLHDFLSGVIVRVLWVDCELLRCVGFGQQQFHGKLLVIGMLLLASLWILGHLAFVLCFVGAFSVNFLLLLLLLSGCVGGIFPEVLEHLLLVARVKCLVHV